MNFVKTAILMAALTALFVMVGAALGGSGGMVMALVFAAATNLWAWWGSDKAVLRMHRAEPVSPQSFPELYDMVARLSARAQLPTPAIYLIHSDQPNAFATGRDPEHAAVAVTTGLIRTLSTEELAGVVAHELAHIKNRDTLIMTIAATVAGAMSTLAQMSIFTGGHRDERNPMGAIFGMLALILAPMAAMIIQMMISRTREYAADRLGAEICGQPVWLASALAKIAGGGHVHPMASAEANPASAHMFIINPLAGMRMDNLFSTHPNTQNRIDALMQQAAEMGLIAHEAPRAVPRRSGTPRVGRRY